jgi:hypothetical protein
VAAVPIGRATKPRVIIPATASKYVIGAGTVTDGIDLRGVAIIAWVVKVQTPLPHVAVHVEKAKSVRCKLTNGRGKRKLIVPRASPDELSMLCLQSLVSNIGHKL